MEIVAWGKHSVGLDRRRNTFNVAETLRVFISIRPFTLAGARTRMVAVVYDVYEVDVASGFSSLRFSFR